MGSGSRCGYPQRREPSLTGDLYEPNISSLPRARCTAPPASACASPAGKPAAATGCCGRPGGRVALAAGHQPATPPPRRTRDQQLPGALPPAQQRGPVRGAVGNRGAVGAGSLQRRLGPGRQPPHGQPPRGRVPRRKRALVQLRFYYGTFKLEGRRVRLPVARADPSCGSSWPTPPVSTRAGSGRHALG
jgi:hypothetical protein